MISKKAPHFAEVFPIYEQILGKDLTFVEINEALITGFRDYLSIQTELVNLSELLTSFGHKNELIAAIGYQLEAETYFSGTGGGVEYTDPAELQSAGIEVIFSDFRHPEYPQLWGAFEANLSVLDLLMNVGKASSKILEKAC
jgi:hypothetical protein